MSFGMFTYLDFRGDWDSNEVKQSPVKISALNKYVDSIFPKPEKENWVDVFSPVQVEVLQRYIRFISSLRFRKVSGASLLSMNLNEPRVVKMRRRADQVKFPVHGWEYVGATLACLNSAGATRCASCGKSASVLHTFINRTEGISLGLSTGCASSCFSFVSRACGNIENTLVPACLQEFAFLGSFMGNPDTVSSYYKYFCGDFGAFLSRVPGGAVLSKQLFTLQSGGVPGTTVNCWSPDIGGFAMEFDEAVRRLPFCLNGFLHNGKLEFGRDVSSKDELICAFDLVDSFLRAGLPVPMSLCRYFNDVLGSVCADISEYFSDIGGKVTVLDLSGVHSTFENGVLYVNLDRVDSSVMPSILRVVKEVSLKSGETEIRFKRV